MKLQKCKTKFRMYQCHIGGKVLNEWDVRALKDSLGNLKTRKSTSRRILSGTLSKNPENSELEPKFKIQSFQSVEFSIDNQFDKHVKNLRR